MVDIMQSQGYLQSLDLNKIPNWDNLLSKFQNPYWQPKGDKHYAAAWNWGSTAIAYNENVTGRKLEHTWDEMWSTDFKGDITMLNNMREAFMAALYKLGYSPNTTDKSHITEAKQELIKQKKLVKGYTSSNVQSFLQNAEASPCEAWTGQAMGAYSGLLKDGKSPIHFIFPKEGTAIWTDCMAIPKGAKHPNAAYAFMNYCLNPRVHAEDSQWLIYPVLLKNEAQYRTDKKFLNLKAVTPTQKMMDNMVAYKNVGQTTKYYSKAWTEIKNA